MKKRNKIGSYNKKQKKSEIHTHYKINQLIH